ncbi:MAG: glycosyltransferase family 1 protein [Candidatus Uhrbacteria bacterium]
MYLAIDCREILSPARGSYAGIPHYVDGVTRGFLEFAPTDWQIVLFFRPDVSLEIIQALQSLRSDVKIILVPRFRSIFFLNHFIFSYLILKNKSDLFFAPAGQLPLGFIGRAVVVVHDLAIYDHPEWFPDNGFVRWFSTKIVVPLSFFRAKKIITISEATKKDLIRHFKIKEEKIFVVHPAVSIPKIIPVLTDELRQKFDLLGRYFLCLGTIEPRKNFFMAVKAAKILCEGGVEFRLVIVGKRGWKWQATVEEIKRVNQSKKIINELGYVSQEEKLALLAGAEALVFPSLYEGFGLPPLEAMKIGTPIITTAVGSLPEACGSAARYVSGTDPEELALAMKEMADLETRKDYIERGKQWSEKFTWKKTIEKILLVLKEK